MKKIIVVLISAILLTGCVKKLEMKTMLVGRVVDFNNNPVEGVAVFVTDCKHTYSSSTTDSEGHFSLSVDFDELDGNYECQLLFSGDGMGVARELKGRGAKLYDYQNVVINILPYVDEMSFARCYVPARFGPMTYYDANDCCRNLVFAGYDDWTLTGADGWHWAYVQCFSFYKPDYYWTNSHCEDGHECFGRETVYSYGAPYCFDNNELHYFIPERIDPSGGFR